MANDHAQSFTDHLRAAIADRRRKLEMLSSDEENDEADDVSQSTLSAFPSKSHTSANLDHSSTARASQSNSATTSAVGEQQQTKTSPMASKETAPQSFKVAAEKLHAQVVGRSLSSFGTIPPPDNFRDRLSRFEGANDNQRSGVGVAHGDSNSNALNSNTIKWARGEPTKDEFRKTNKLNGLVNGISPSPSNVLAPTRDSYTPAHRTQTATVRTSTAAGLQSISTFK